MAKTRTVLDETISISKKEHKAKLLKGLKIIIDIKPTDGNKLKLNNKEMVNKVTEIIAESIDSDVDLQWKIQTR